MPDFIVVSELAVDARVGVKEHERLAVQRLVIDLRLATDLRKAASEDNLAFTVNYDRVAALTREIVSAEHHKLIETVAEKIAANLLDAFPVTSVFVRVAKPGAVHDAKTVSVELSRTRNGTNLPKL